MSNLILIEHTEGLTVIPGDRQLNVQEIIRISAEKGINLIKQNSQLATDDNTHADRLVATLQTKYALHTFKPTRKIALDINVGSDGSRLFLQITQRLTRHDIELLNQLAVAAGTQFLDKLGLLYFEDTKELNHFVGLLDNFYDIETKPLSPNNEVKPPSPKLPAWKIFYRTGLAPIRGLTTAFGTQRFGWALIKESGFKKALLDVFNFKRRSIELVKAWNYESKLDVQGAYRAINPPSLNLYGQYALSWSGSIALAFSSLHLAEQSHTSIKLPLMVLACAISWLTLLLSWQLWKIRSAHQDGLRLFLIAVIHNPMQLIPLLPRYMWPNFRK